MCSVKLAVCSACRHQFGILISERKISLGGSRRGDTVRKNVPTGAGCPQWGKDVSVLGPAPTLAVVLYETASCSGLHKN